VPPRGAGAGEAKPRSPSSFQLSHKPNHPAPSFLGPFPVGQVLELDEGADGGAGGAGGAAEGDAAAGPGQNGGAAAAQE